MTNQDTDQYRQCREMEKTHVCAQCGGRINTVYDDKTNLYINVCGEHHEHKGLKRTVSATEVLKRGEMDQIAGRGAQKDAETYLERQQPNNPLMSRADVATGVALTNPQLLALVEFARSVNLKAFLGHVCYYQGKPYITIDGYYYLKGIMGADFVVATYPMSKQERKDYQVADGDHAYIARAISHTGVVLGTGIGIVTIEEIMTKSKRNQEQFAAPVVHNKPQIMAEKRAEWQLMQKMIPLGVKVPAPAAAAPAAKPDPDQVKKDENELFG